MNLSSDQVIALIKKGVPDKLELARKHAKKINMHITGQYVKDFLEKLDDYETEAQKLLREKLVKSNRSLFSFILRPTDKIFTAKGGSVAYNLPQTKINYLKEAISSVADGLDIKKYLKKIVKKHYIIDPNGIIFIDIDPDGKLETHIVGSDQIFCYLNKGNRVDAIIFEPYKKKLTDEEKKPFIAIGEERVKKEEDKRYFRVIDGSLDRIFVQDGNDYYEEISSRLDNYFKFVPAMILGDEKSYNEDIFESFVSDVIDDADAFLRDVSTATIHNLAHLYPRYWSYAQACTRCEGEGTIKMVVTEAVGETPAVIDETVCPSCGGQGDKRRTNPSDELVVPVPQEGDPVLAPHLMGYESPDLDTAKFYVDMIEKGKNSMFQAIWGTTYEQGGKRETATGRFLDAQPVQDRLREVSDTFAKLHKFMLECYGKVLLMNPQYTCSVSYGTRYILESPDDILDKLIEVSRENTPTSIKLDLMKRYLEAEYQNDSIELFKRKKLSKLEPFPTMQPNVVAAIQGLDPQEKLKKLFYPQWVANLKDEQVILMSEEQLEQNFTKFITNKTFTDEQVQRE